MRILRLNRIYIFSPIRHLRIEIYNTVEMFVNMSWRYSLNIFLARKLKMIFCIRDWQLSKDFL